jgi:hypothetical protein
MILVILNLSTEKDSDNLGKKGGGKRYYGATPFELAVREKIKLYPVNGREERIRKEEIWSVVEVLV